MTECSQYEEDVVSCIESETYNLSNFLRGAEKGSVTKESLTNASLWSEEVGWLYFGRCHTMKHPIIVSSDYLKDYLMFYLDKNVNYKIFIHEENYFEMVNNLLSFPNINIDLETNSSYNHYYQMTLTEHRELDVPQDPCEEDPGYNFRACVKESLSSQVGCRTKWDQWSDRAWPLCMDLSMYK